MADACGFAEGPSLAAWIRPACHFGGDCSNSCHAPLAFAWKILKSTKRYMDANVQTPPRAVPRFRTSRRSVSLALRIFRTASEAIFRSLGFPELPSERFSGRSDFQRCFRIGFSRPLISRSASETVFRGLGFPESASERFPGRSEFPRGWQTRFSCYTGYQRPFLASFL
jgi:hypothetical protein